MLHSSCNGNNALLFPSVSRWERFLTRELTWHVAFLRVLDYPSSKRREEESKKKRFQVGKLHPLLPLNAAFSPQRENPVSPSQQHPDCISFRCCSSRAFSSPCCLSLVGRGKNGSNECTNLSNRVVLFDVARVQVKRAACWTKNQQYTKKKNAARGRSCCWRWWFWCCSKSLVWLCVSLYVLQRICCSFYEKCPVSQKRATFDVVTTTPC